MDAAFCASQGASAEDVSYYDTLVSERGTEVMVLR